LTWLKIANNILFAALLMGAVAEISRAGSNHGSKYREEVFAPGRQDGIMPTIRISGAPTSL